MVEDGVLMMGGAKLEQAAPALSFADRGFGERDLATFLRLGSGFNEEPLDWFDRVDEIEVQKEGEGRRSLLFTVWLWIYFQTKVMCLYLTHAYGVTVSKLHGTIPTNTQTQVEQGLHFLPLRKIPGLPSQKNVHYEATEELGTSFMLHRPRPSPQPNLRNPRSG